MTSDRRKNDRRKENREVARERRHNERRTQPDRRTSVRLPLELWMEEVSGDALYFRQTGNVSSGGVFFDRAIPHPEGTFVTLKFTLPGDPEMVVARGEVVSAAGAQDGLGMNVKFTQIEGDGADRLEQYISSFGV